MPANISTAGVFTPLVKGGKSNEQFKKRKREKMFFPFAGVS
jgi:hypothetical protein